jgi:hypothetical protein
MLKKGNSKAKRRSPPQVKLDEQPLLQFLVAQANHRGDSLATMAKSLGVTYARLAQWRRNESFIRNARRLVLERAAAYLEWPVICVLMHADVVRLTDFGWPGNGTMNDYLKQEIARMRRDRRFGPLVPQVLEQSDVSLQMLVVHLFNSIEQTAKPDGYETDWLKAMRKVTETYLKDLNSFPAEGTQPMPAD